MSRHPLRQPRSNRSAGYLRYSKQAQYDEYDDDNDQNMDPTACLREAWAYITTEKAEQPQD